MSDDLKHHGVKGMKWGVRRYQNKNGSLKPAGKKRGKATQKVGTAFLRTSKEGRAALKEGESTKVKKALSSYKKSMEKADAKSAARTAKRNATVKKVGKEANRKLPNAAVGMAASLAINSVLVGPAAMTGRAFLGGGTGAVLGVLAANAVAVNSGMKIYDQLMDNSSK